MEATSSTAGKMAVKTGELFTGTIAEGTIFSIPDIYNAYTESEDLIKTFSDKKSRNYIGDEQERAKAIAKVRESRNDTMLDAWSESVATMAGFKMKHEIKMPGKPESVLYAWIRGDDMLLLMVYVSRKSWIERPLVKRLSRMLLN